jgi:hypothetical protein
MIILDKTFNVDPQPHKLYKNVTIARSGYQEYLESEIKQGGSPLKVVMVYRDKDEVKKSVETMQDAPITENHPKEFLDYQKGNVKIIGIIKKAWFEDGKVKANLLFFSSPKYKEFSLGYSSKIVHDGGNYRQTEIKINHLANLSNSRCGKICSITDKNTKGIKMANVVINDKAFEVADEVKAYIDVLDKNKADVKDVAQKAFEDGRKKALEEIELKETAKAFNVDVKDGATATEIKREIVTSLGINTDGKSDEYLIAVIDTQKALRATPESIKKETRVNDGFDFDKYIVGGE